MNAGQCVNTLPWHVNTAPDFVKESAVLLVVPAAWRNFVPQFLFTAFLSRFNKLWRQRYLSRDMKHIFFLILTTLAFSFCAPDAPARKQSLETYVRYLEQEGQIHTEATMRIAEPGKEPLPVEVAGGIRYQGMEMSIQPVRSITYRFDKTGGFETNHAFSWKDDKGRELSFHTQLDPISSFGFGNKVVDRSKAATFSWEGKPLGKGEALVFMWENPEKHLTNPLEVINPGPVSRISYPAAKLSELEPGTWTLYLVRKKLIKTDVNGVECSGIIEYFTRTDTVEVR